MALLPLDPAELARRLGIVVDASSQPHLEAALAVASRMIDPRCDPLRVEAAPEAYLEGCYQLAVKVWDTATRGLVSLDPGGAFDLTAAATGGMWRSVLGVLQPVLTTGGIVVG